MDVFERESYTRLRLSALKKRRTSMYSETVGCEMPKERERGMLRISDINGLINFKSKIREIIQEERESERKESEEVKRKERKQCKNQENI